MFARDALQGVHVLVVDDDPATCQVLTASLEIHGASVECAGSMAEALRAIEKRRPDVLVSDLRMPGGSGLELIQALRLRTPERGGAIRAIALSGWTAPEDRELAEVLGYERFLVKPIDLEDLVGAILAAVETRPLPPAAALEPLPQEDPAPAPRPRASAS